MLVHETKYDIIDGIAIIEYRVMRLENISFYKLSTSSRCNSTAGIYIIRLS